MNYLLFLFIGGLAVYPPVGSFPSKQSCEAIKVTMRAPDSGGTYHCILSWGNK